MTVNTISRDQARKYYDRFGSLQDRQGFYEDAALDRMIELGRFAECRGVLEIGCGTGRLAERLLADHLGASAGYTGVDLSSTMVKLASDRLTPYRQRAAVMQSEGDFDFSCFDGPFDRLVATYVLDLLSDADIRRCLDQAHAALRPGGLLCVCGLTDGSGPVSRLTSWIWSVVFRLRPTLVGGCRPLTLSGYLSGDRWRNVTREVVVSAGIPSEVIIAEAR